jgi:hypothetical protein
MADIDIVPKHRSYLWLWILIALVVIAVLWWALSGNNAPARVGSSSLASPALTAQAVAASVFPSLG